VEGYIQGIKDGGGDEIVIFFFLEKQIRGPLKIESG
jgi:hypothetical protein